MITFNSILSLILCANTRKERRKWAAIFERLFTGGRTVIAKGFYLGYPPEPNLVISTAFNCHTNEGKRLLQRFCRYGKVYHQLARQDSVYFEFIHYKVYAVIVESLEDWRLIERCLLERSGWMKEVA